MLNMNLNNDQYASAGFAIRCGALILDLAILVLVLSTLLILIPTNSQFEFRRCELCVVSEWFDTIGNIMYVLVPVYFIGFWLFFAATPGKMWCNLRIVDSRSGSKPNFIQFVLRYIGYIISLLPLCLGFFWVLFDLSKQSWHDQLARTAVVKIKGSRTTACNSVNKYIF